MKIILVAAVASLPHLGMSERAFRCSSSCRQFCQARCEKKKKCKNNETHACPQWWVALRHEIGLHHTENIRFSRMICLINIPELMKSDIYTIYVYGVNQEYKLSMLLCVRWSHLFFIHQGSRAQSWPALCSCTSSSCLSCILRCFKVFLMHQLAQLHALLQNTATEFS